MAYGKTLSSVVSCNVSYKDEITAEILVGILSGKLPIGNWKTHIDVFSNELPGSYIRGVMEENAISMQQLISVFEARPTVFQGQNFKKLMHA